MKTTKLISKTLGAAMVAAALFLSSSTVFAQGKFGGPTPPTMDANSLIHAEGSTANRNFKVSKTDTQLTIQDGTEGNGKVLTSDASGNASWQTISAACNAFEASRSSQTIPVVNSVNNLVVNNELFDQSSAYDPSTGMYTVPVTGTYIFTATAADGGSVGGIRNSSMNLISSVKGNLSSVNNANNVYTNGTWMTVSAVTRATAGEKIRVSYTVAHSSGASQSTIDVTAIRFSGSRIDCDK